MNLKLLLSTFQRGAITLKENVNQKFLEEQLDWCKKQDRILEAMETTLYKMKRIAEYAAENKLNPFETKRLNDEMNLLKEEVASLEKQLRPSQITH